MRDYGKVSPRFWTGETGRKIRDAGGDAQRVALYLLTCPMSSMIGMYYCPLPTLAHEVGISIEGATKALASLAEAQFAYWDGTSEVVFVPEMASHQIGEPLDVKDNRVKGVIREWIAMRKCPFFMDFYRRYKESFLLPEPSPIKGPYKPLPSQEHEHEHEHESKDPGVPGSLSDKSDATADSDVPEGLKRLMVVWNEIEGIQPFQRITKKRVTAFRARSKQAGWMESVKPALEKVKASDFCHGKGERNWLADIDWFLRPDTVVKILEGKYDNRNGHASDGFTDKERRGLEATHQWLQQGTT